MTTSTKNGFTFVDTDLVFQVHQLKVGQQVHTLVGTMLVLVGGRPWVSLNPSPPSALFLAINS